MPAASSVERSAPGRVVRTPGHRCRVGGARRLQPEGNVHGPGPIAGIRGAVHGGLVQPDVRQRRRVLLGHRLTHAQRRRPSLGRAAITAAAQGFMTAFPDMVVTIDGVEVRGEGAVYRWTLTGTYSGPGGSGRPVRISGYEEWRFGADGLIAESKGHFDAADYERQLRAPTAGGPLASGRRRSSGDEVT